MKYLYHKTRFSCLWLLLIVSYPVHALETQLKDSVMNRGEITSAVGSIDADVLNRTVAINPANALYGLIPGLTVLQNGGTDWNNNPTLFIRGVETFNLQGFKNTNILTIVDGFEQPVSSLSLAEIESVSVLKDAAALAMYGMRGANGVLLVTTKRGKGRELSVKVNYEHGVTQAFRLPDLLNSYDYSKSVNQARINDGLTPLYSQQMLDKYKSGESPYLFPNVDWLNESLNKFGYTNNFNISFQQQTKSVRHFTLLNLESETGLLKPVDLNPGYKTQIDYYRFNFRTNIDVDLTKTTIFSIKLSGNIGENRRPATPNNEGDIISAIYNTPALAFPVKTEDKIWGISSTFKNNPVALISSVGYNVQASSEIKTIFTLEQKLDKILNGLSAEATFSYNKQATHIDSYIKTYQSKEEDPVIDAVTGAISDQVVNTPYGANTTLDFSHWVVSQRQHMAALIDLNYGIIWGNNTLQSKVLFQGEELMLTGQNNTYRHLLTAGNIHYAKAGKYFADVVLSYNGTNVLPVEKRFGFFPAISLAWKLSNEEWLKENPSVNFLKIRASYGLTGNDQVIQNISTNNFAGASGYYYGSSNTFIGGSTMFRLASSPTYETSAKSNIGLDATFFKVLNLTADAFYDKRTGILVEAGGSVSKIIGINPPFNPDGIVTNKGFEIGLNLKGNKNDFKYCVGGQLSYAKNKIINMDEAYQPEGYLKRTGQSIGQAFGLQAIGFFKDAADIAASPKQTFSIVSPGDVKYKDQNGDKIIDKYDNVPIGYSTQNPEFYYSGTINLEYKGIGIDALIQGIANKTLYLNTPTLFWPLRGNMSITHFSDNAWTPENAQTATLPRLSMSENANNFQANSIWLADGSYLKLRHVQLYYDLPESFLTKMKLSKVKLYVEGLDLFSIDKIKCVDPEVTDESYIPLTTYLFGIQVNF